MAYGAGQTNWLRRWAITLAGVAVLAPAPAPAQDATDDPTQLVPGPTELTPEPQSESEPESGESALVPIPSPAQREPEPPVVPEPPQAAAPPAQPSAPVSGGVFLTSLSRAPSQVKLCPTDDCPSMDEHPYDRVLTVAIYEARAGWVRVSKYVESEKLQARYPGVELPARVAMWVPVDALPSAVAALYPAAPEKVEKPAGETRLAALPAQVPVPSRRPQVGLVQPSPPEQEVPEQQAPEPSVTTEPSPDSEQAASADPEPVEPQETAGEADGVVIPTPAPRADDAVAAETATADAPQEQQVATAEPAGDEEPQPAEPAEPAEPPETLTAELKDKRLSALPLKPTDEISLKAIIALRYQALQLLESGECSGIREGGQSLSGPGWFYVTCEGDYQFRQFFVE